MWSEGLRASQRIFFNMELSRGKARNIQKCKHVPCDLIVCPSIRVSIEAEIIRLVKWGIILTRFVILLLPMLIPKEINFIWFISVTLSTF